MSDEEEADVAAMLDLSKKKKKKKKKTTTSKKSEGGSGGATEGVPVDASEQQRLLAELDEAQEVGDPNDRKADYTYEELLERVVDLLQANNPDLVEKKRTRIKPPQMQTISSRKCMWVNFQEICTMMQRDPQHVYQFFMTELGTEGSIDGNQRLIIRKFCFVWEFFCYYSVLIFCYFSQVVATCPSILNPCFVNMCWSMSLAKCAVLPTQI